MHSILAARTDLSIGESIISAENLVDLAVQAGEKSVALTDTMSVTSMIDFTKRAKDAGLKPIIGTRLRLTDDPRWRPAKGEKKKNMPPAYFITAYALTEAGMKAIFRLLTLGNSDEYFYYVSKIGFDDLYKELGSIAKTDLALVLGDEEGVLAHPGHHSIVDKLKRLCGRVYAPLVPVDMPYYGRMNKLAIETGLPLITVRPALYDTGGADAQDIMNGIATGTKAADPWFRTRYTRDLAVIGKEDLIEEIKKAALHLRRRTNWSLPDCIGPFKDGLAATDDLVAAVEYEWTKADVSLPVMAPDEFKAVAAECSKGWKDRFGSETFGHKPTEKELSGTYLPRLKYELSVLKRLNFSGYFLLVQDIVQFSKKNGILVGPGRGSVGGSLVAYLMGITDCDPIRFGLMFERFINPDRIDLPDADLDFMSKRRHEVVEYIISKYGRDRVAGVSNFGTLASASVIRDVGRTLGIPEREYSISKMVPKKHGQNVSLEDSRKEVSEIETFAFKYADIWPIMEKLEGNTRNLSQHAAGIVIANEDIVNRAVIERRKENSVVCWDKRIVEEQGLVKVDILGLSTLDLIALTLEYIQDRHGKTIDLNKIPLDDPKVLANFASGNTTGIFQFESGGMRRLLREIAATGTITFEEITAATALYRPGPMESGMMDSFYKRKQGDEHIEYDHPLMEPILDTTYGVIVYQEQVMKISQVIAGYNGAEADKLRKIMGKKLPAEMEKQREKFCNGCIATIGADAKWAGALFDKIAGFAGYGFNLSHSVEYSLISYQSMWLKTNYPVEFYASSLTLMDEDKLSGLISEASKTGIIVEVPDINHSTMRFEIVSGNRMVIPFQRIKGISLKTVEAILEARSAGSFLSMNDFLARIEKRRCNISHQNALNRVGAFARIDPTQPAFDDPVRIKDQIDLIPGLIASSVPVDHEICRDTVTRDAIKDLVQEYRTANSGDGMPCKPSFGRAAKFMIIADAASNDEDNGGVIGFGRGNSAVLEAMDKSDFKMGNVYWTALVKRAKKDKILSAEEINTYKNYLYREISILKPPVIVLLGSTVTRHFLPDFRGKASEAAGKVVYNKVYDANMVIGFSPGEIWFDPDKQENMNAVFAAVAELLN